jgi:hypothetical protein
MSSLPNWVENDLKLLEILFFAYEMKPYKLKNFATKFEFQTSSKYMA